MDDDAARPALRGSWPLLVFVALISVLAVGSILTYVVMYTLHLRQGPAPAVVRTPAATPAPPGQPCVDDQLRPCATTGDGQAQVTATPSTPPRSVA
ncbi:hypothetical protein OHA72_15050 [Dactylosporangium sp. NBC_01737]|uniref:hypothetical protein n=1 Tax=Dactylosporangium sp. NBC_01737 TaxID=2975959 RepID=UPI002E1111DF|nr:hypothetical protein OHA72_15050 [Dactylosporangium sp. NBC_01737]